MTPTEFDDTLLLHMVRYRALMRGSRGPSVGELLEQVELDNPEGPPVKRQSLMYRLKRLMDDGLVTKNGPPKPNYVPTDAGMARVRAMEREPVEGVIGELQEYLRARASEDEAVAKLLVGATNGLHPWDLPNVHQHADAMDARRRAEKKLLQRLDGLVEN